MRASKIAARAVLVCSAAGIACVLWSALDETPADASDRGGSPLPPVLDVTGDLGDTPVRTVEQLPRLATKLTEATTRAPERVTRAQDPVKEIRTTAADVVQPITRTPALPASTPKLPTPKAPTRGDTATPDEREAVPAVVLLSGAAPGTVTLGTTPADSIAPAAALLCGDQVAESIPRPGQTAVPNRPCVPDDSDTTGGLATMKPPTKTGVDQLAAITPTGPATPALRLLGELLPRSDLPTGRTTPPEPGPA